MKSEEKQQKRQRYKNNKHDNLMKDCQKMARGEEIWQDKICYFM
jgi:hypothetical protein